MVKKSTLVSALLAGLCLAASPALAQESKPGAGQGEQKRERKHDGKQDGTKKDETAKDDKKAEIAIGSQAPTFTLMDLEGKEHSLAAHTKQGHIVVLFWFNPDCPFVKKHYENGANTFNDLAKKYADKKVVFLAINSGASGMQGAGKERNAKAKKDWKIEHPILLDEAGTTGKAYGAKNTPACYIIAADGTLAYMGAIDDDPSMKVGKTNYVAKALDEILAGKPVTTATTKPYGCSVKYAK